MLISRKRRILVLESRPPRRAILTEVLAAHFELTLTSSVAEACIELQTASGEIDLVVSALQVQTGESVFDVLREATRRGVPLIYFCLFPSSLTTTLQDSMFTAAKSLGAREVLLQKQLDAAALLRLIGSVLDAKPPS